MRDYYLDIHLKRDGAGYGHETGGNSTTVYILVYKDKAKDRNRRFFIHQIRFTQHKEEHRFSEWTGCDTADPYYHLGTSIEKIPPFLRGLIRSVEWSPEEPWFISNKEEPVYPEEPPRR